MYNVNKNYQHYVKFYLSNKKLKLTLKKCLKKNFVSVIIEIVERKYGRNGSI